MIVSPGTVIGEFLNGITIRYAHPFRFVFIWSTLSAILAVYFGTVEDTSVAMNQAMGMSEEQIQRGQKVLSYIQQYMSFVTMSMIPLLSIGTSLMFRSKKFTYAEHLILNSYTQSSVIIITLPVTISYAFYHEIGVIGYANFLIVAIVHTRAYVQVFKVNWFKALFKYILAFIINMILFIIIIVILSIAIAIAAHFLGFENPFKPA